MITWELAWRLRQRGLLLPVDKNKYDDEELYLIAVKYKENLDRSKLLNVAMDMMDDEIGFRATLAEFQDK